MNGETYAQTWCTFSDGRHYDFAIPTKVIEASTTGGRSETLRFLHRIEVAREVLKHAPEFEAVFTEIFQPIVLHLACVKVMVQAAEVLIKKLSACDREAVESIRDSCKTFPYLNVTSSSPNHFDIELVQEAISLEKLFLHVEAIFRPPLQKLCSAWKVANWGMAHILAWTLEDFAQSVSLRRQLVGLSPGQADQVIWNHAWQGDESSRRLAEAAHIMGSEIAAFVAKALDIENRKVDWTERVLGLRSSQYYLEIASEADRIGHAVLEWATTTYASLPASEAFAVAETLRRGSWRTFSDEAARQRFVSTEAQRKIQELELIVLSSIGGLPGQRNSSVDDWQDCGLPIREISLQVLKAREPLPHSTTDFRVIDTLLALKRAMSSLRLDTQRVVYVRMQDYSREEANTVLQLPKKRVSAAWKDLTRKKDYIREAILG